MAKKFSKPNLSRIINGDIPIAADTPITVDKKRLDHTLVEQYAQYNRSTIQKFIKNGQVTVNQKIITKPNYLTSKQDQIELKILEAENNPPEIPIIYSDDKVIVVNKPTGLLTVSKGNFNPEPTLESLGYIVHRLDRDTSGVIIIAKDEATRAYLQKQFQDRRAHKIYYAITTGVPKLDQAIIDIPLARNLKHPTTFQPDPTGRAAITEYKVLANSEHFALLMLKPKTGRTHQLRVHLKHIGTPILGDPIYGAPTKFPSNINRRLYLHAAQLEITLPGGIRRTFEAPIPDDFSYAIANLISTQAVQNVLQ